MEFHEAAGLFPMMDDAAFSELCRDIGKQGLIEPIWTYEGKIIDGRNRYRACERLQIEPSFREWSGSGSLTQFVVSLNLNRRHLTTGQKAAIAVAIIPMLAAEAKERQREHGGTAPGKKSLDQNSVQVFPRANVQAADVVGISHDTVAKMKKLTEEAPELAKQVKQGKKTVNQAYQEIKPIPYGKEVTIPRPKGEQATQAMQFAVMAISQLERIKNEDPQSVAALTRVQNWITNRLKGE